MEKGITIMLNEEKFIDLLTKQDLSAKEKKRLLDEYRHNPELKDFDAIVKALTELAKDEHISTDTLSEYVLFLNGDKSGESKIAFLVHKIEKHLKTCSKCREEFEFLSSEFNNVDSFINESISEKKQLEKVQAENSKIFNIFGDFKIKYAYRIAASIILAVSSLFVASRLTTPQYVRVASSNNYENFSSVRGRTSSDFTNAVNELENENYKSAISDLKTDIKKNPNELTTFYSYYILGITYLTEAHSDFAGLFDRYNQKDLSTAIRNFKKVLELNKSSLFKNVNSNTYFFIGKAYLLEENFNDAKKYLTKAIDSESEYSNEAEELLSSIK